jgi:transposase-like protein
MLFSKKNRRYSREFKHEAARLVVEEMQPLEEVARELGIQIKQLQRWKRRYIRILSMHFMGRHH